MPEHLPLRYARPGAAGARTSPVTPTPSASCSAGTATGCGRWRCAPTRNPELAADAVQDGVPRGLPAGRLVPRARRRSPPGCTGSSSTPASTGCAAIKPHRRAARRRACPSWPTATTSMPESRCASTSAGPWTGCPRASGWRSDPGRHARHARGRGGLGAGRGGGHGQVPVRPRPGRAWPMLLGLAGDPAAGRARTGPQGTFGVALTSYPRRLLPSRAPARRTTGANEVK